MGGDNRFVYKGEVRKKISQSKFIMKENKNTCMCQRFLGFDNWLHKQVKDLFKTYSCITSFEIMKIIWENEDTIFCLFSGHSLSYIILLL